MPSFEGPINLKSFFCVPRFAALAPKAVDDPCVAFGNYVGVQLQQMSPMHRKKVMSDIMNCICRLDESVEVVVSMSEDGMHCNVSARFLYHQNCIWMSTLFVLDQTEAFNMTPGDMTLTQDGDLLHAEDCDGGVPKQ